ncbi:MAG TPA: Hpt domain-containing protein [Syntrophales bacterium]|nr:Hpt domain-containing protein [Syntrophales bacterium]HOX93283.1 Hpt domain-containing protein [Syntrophales bacterium]HPI56243.1 Hpt domain-containing protein [Syntrophales bacterium]HPN24430.1 Hpt domain-containing protein [Syntrophales bacterium]HQM29060.1 Hpt domain-containing protein [Syntrophales bacterium]
MNFRQMADRIGFSEEEFMELVELFLESSLAELDHINAAAKEMDFSRMAMCAHSIRGAAINLGFEEIHALAKAIEGNARANELNGTIEAAEKIKDNLEQIVGTMVLSGRH